MRARRLLPWLGSALAAGVCQALQPAEDPWGTSEARVGRYELRRLGPSRSQAEPLAALVQLRFGPDVRTLGQAVRRLLLGSGYALASRAARGGAAGILETRPLPQVHRSLGPMPLGEALRTLAGDEWDLVVDPLHRLVGFDLVQPWSGELHRRVQAGGALAPGRQRAIQIRAGSLKAAVEHLAHLFGFRLVGWEDSLQRDGVPLDWRIAAPWVLHSGDLDGALRVLLPPFGLRAELHLLDRTLSVHWEASPP